MRKYCLLLLVFIFLNNNLILSQELRKNQSKDAAVLLSVKTYTSPPKIVISWEKHPLAYSYEIRRKNFGDMTFPTNPLAVLSSSVTSYTDNNVQLGKEYEYEVRARYKALADVTMQRPDGSTVDTTIALHFMAFGYVHTGINVPPRHSFGKVLVVIDETLQWDLQLEIETYVNDLIEEGWTVVTKYVPRAENFDPGKVQQVKNLILEEYEKDPINFNTVVLLGRVAVPYSGLIAPDGHPDHLGAWPCDMYYGSIYDTYWTDFSVNNSSASDPRNRNIPNDGKFDQNTPGYEISFGVGRIDFFKMPKFTEGETSLLRAYLTKNHLFRTGQMQVKWRGLIDDNFGANRYLNAFASSGYRNFASLLGPSNIVVADWFTTLKTDDYLWAYGCGGGTYTSAGGIGTTDDFVANKVNAVFTMLFGSYFGDWDSQNNFMRAALASKPSILTCSWAGFPHWYFHNMAANLPIGYSTKLTQSNYTNYFGASYSQDSVRFYLIGQGLYQVHVALMGDPTLTQYSSAVPKPQNVSVYQPEGGPVKITWQAPSEPVDGFFIYKSYSKNGEFTLLNQTPLSETQFVDSSLYEGLVYYMVRSYKMVENNSGTFGILSRGAVQYAKITNVESLEKEISLEVAPNPFENEFVIQVSLPNNSIVEIELYDMIGNKKGNLFANYLSSGVHRLSFNLSVMSDKSGIPNGIYFLKVSTNSKVLIQRIVKIGN
ncbi:MAG: T9SS type A sorting domain-containing protein [Ignavibacteria bacterium]|nr:T9SS type A sorting domain-containing protein [Ignavibacteria bacterium]